MQRLIRVVIIGIVIAMAGTMYATQVLFTDFEGFKINASIDGQNGWAATNPAWDQKVVSFGGNTVWRVSNAVTSGSFGDMPFAPRLGGIPLDTMTNPTNGSPGAFAGESSTGTSLKHFQASFSFRSATGTGQPGARITVSADNGQGGRQSFIALKDTGSGIEVSTEDVDSNGMFSDPIVIASGLSYGNWHTTRVGIEFKDGPNNDVVVYFVDGRLVHTGPSWEQFYRNSQAAIHPLGVPVQTLLFRLSSNPDNPPCTGCLGGGFFVDNVALSVNNEEDKDEGEGEDNDHNHMKFQDSPSHPENGQMQYYDAAQNMNVQSVNGVGSISYNNTCVNFAGDALKNGNPGYVYTFTACDLQVLGTGIGTFTINVAGPLGFLYQKSGVLTSGYVSIHPH